jgi:hypothetical protein
MRAGIRAPHIDTLVYESRREGVAASLPSPDERERPEPSFSGPTGPQNSTGPALRVLQCRIDTMLKATPAMAQGWLSVRGN